MKALPCEASETTFSLALNHEVTIVEYDPRWLTLFAEAACIRTVGDVIAVIEHYEAQRYEALKRNLAARFRQDRERRWQE